MSHILFLNKCWGVDFMLMRRLQNENVEYGYVSLVGDEDHKDVKLYEKYGVRGTPCLITFKDGIEQERLKGLDEIIKYLKNEQNTKIPVA